MNELSSNLRACVLLPLCIGMEAETFEASGANASLVRPVRAGEVRNGHYVMLKGFPCKVIEVTTSKTGKHGHAKAKIVGLDIFTGEKKIDIAPTSHNLEQPIVAQKEWQVIDIQDNFCSLLDADGNEGSIALPEHEKDKELKDRILALFDGGNHDVMVTVLSSMEKEAITSMKTIEA
jgi:translation initiation factor 5A